ncbi:MAG: PEP-CTERM sorting domain-containing protein [Pirellulales bacterium]|nr:PEP-CTERM sorting domain-containing protein [Pirellulales bacterium]
MRKHLVGIAVAAAALCAAGSARAQAVYSFESGLEGFAPNGGGATVDWDVVGATEGAYSMKVSVVGGATFVGALTANVAAAIGDPPGVNAILFDMTIPSEFTGSFALVGVTVFAASQPDYPGGQQFGLQAQFADFEHIGGKAAGTYNDVRIDLDSTTHPLTFATGQSFNDVFGGVGSGPTDLIPTGFQLFFNKSNDAPLTVYIDNIRTVIPEPATAGMLAAACALLGLARRRRG